MEYTKSESEQGVILPLDHEYFTFIKKVIRYHARRAGMKRIATHAIEEAGQIKKYLGEASKVVAEQLVGFEYDGAEMSLRSDMTVGIADAYIKEQFSEQPKPVEFYYIEPVWRRVEKDGIESLEQHHNFGFEVLGEIDPALDAQLIEMCYNIFQDLGITSVKLRINSAGTAESKEQYIEDLRNFYAGKERSLCEKCVQKVGVNPLMVLACENEDCQILSDIAPKFSTVIDKGAKEHFTKVKEYLEELDIPFDEDEKLVGASDINTRTIFEFYVDNDGRREVIGLGGRHDDLLEKMGAEETPVVGFSASMEKIAAYMKDIHLRVPSKDKVSVFVVQLGDDAKRIALKLASDLRKKGVKTVGALGKASIRAQLDSASEFEVQYALVLGQMEVVEKKIILRDMAKGTQEILPFEGIVDHMVQLLGTSQLDTKDFRAMIEEATESE